MAVGLTTEIKLSTATRQILLHILQTHNSTNPIFLDLASRLNVNQSLVKPVTQEEVLALIAELQGGGYRCLPPEAIGLLKILRKAAEDFSKASNWH